MLSPPKTKVPFLVLASAAVYNKLDFALRMSHGSIPYLNVLAVTTKWSEAIIPQRKYAESKDATPSESWRGPNSPVQARLNSLSRLNGCQDVYDYS